MDTGNQSAGDRWVTSCRLWAGHVQFPLPESCALFLTVMASEAVLIQAKVARLLSRRHGKPVLKPALPLELRDSVSKRKEKVSEASCLPEMSGLMACWKENAFSDKVCSNEIDNFYKCVAQAQANRKAGVLDQSGSFMPAAKINSLLRKYPNIKHEI